MKRSKSAEVEIQVTPMLDMAFQLLTFFIMTYRPAPAEGQFSMNLLPGQPTVSANAPISTESAESSDVPAGLKQLPTVLRAGPGGSLGRITVGEKELGSLDELRGEIKTIKSDPDLPFDQTLIQVDPRLRYSELIKVIDAFSKEGMTKISFAELAPEGVGGGP